MRIAVFLVDQIYANAVAKSLIKELPTEIDLFVESGVLLQNRTLLNSLKRYLRISGYYYVVNQLLKVEIYRILSMISHLFLRENNKFYHYHRLAEKKKIKVIKVKDVNSEEFWKFLKKRKIDLVVSVFFNQILESSLIHLPALGVINVHPAYLPNYKGTGPIFWSLVNKEKFVGATVHFIDEGIDTGKIILRKKIKVDDKDTEDSLYWKSAQAGSHLLISAIKGIKDKKIVPMENKGGKNFKIPTNEAVRKFRKQGRSFFVLKDFLFNQ